jgi:hypothetical protein
MLLIEILDQVLEWEKISTYPIRGGASKQAGNCFEINQINALGLTVKC